MTPYYEAMQPKAAIAARLRAKCDWCNGEGGTRAGGWVVCPNCNESGFAPIDREALAVEVEAIAHEIRHNTAGGAPWEMEKLAAVLAAKPEETP